MEELLREANGELGQLRRRIDVELTEAANERRAAEEALARAHNELSTLTDAKLSLEAEIQAYRRLLETQEGVINESRASSLTRGPHQSGQTREDSPLRSRSVSRQRVLPPASKPASSMGRTSPTQNLSAGLQSDYMRPKATSQIQHQQTQPQQQQQQQHQQKHMMSHDGRQAFMYSPLNYYNKEREFICKYNSPKKYIQ
ncbi:unnamed protein product [Protopolystoma xenopodis]|uniref:IF rod domain-containing protein n=1 Tax=Protopolystoma xenopodis TaxID=117903 RepID=A0A448WHI1_9PLAT|nr:unnamed protein product [Protopolystoma xenopodis]